MSDDRNFPFYDNYGEYDDRRGQFGDRRGQHGDPQAQGQYGDPRGQYGDPRGQYGDPHGQYGDPRGQYGDPHGQYGDPRGQYGDPRGQYADHRAQHDQYDDSRYDDRREERGRRHSVSSGPGNKKKKKKKRGRSGLALTLTFVMLVCLGGGIYFGYQKLADKFIVPDYAGEGTGEVEITIPAGANGAEMAEVLKTADVVKSEKAFTTAFTQNENAKSIQPGTYKLRKQMSGVAAVILLLDPKSKLSSGGITIPEGWSSFRIFKELSAKLKLPEEDFKNAAKDPVKLGVPESWFKRKDGKTVQKSIEGFLFPDTYQFDAKVTAEAALKKMVARFLQVSDSISFTQKVDSNLLTPYDALIIASLSQAEVRHAADLGKVARVSYNRLFKSSPHLACRCLQYDVTVNYWFELNGQPIKTSAQMTEADLKNPANPYNRDIVGLVPTPINNPGKAALEAAMAPPAGTWLFFVAVDQAGTTNFSSTPSAFCTDKKLAVRNKVLTNAGC